ncbi:MAG: carbon-nitrogen hydrolase family protein [Anaerolineales bacterium]
MNTIQKSRKMRVAAIQVQSRPGEMAANYAHALPFIEAAAAQGAQLAVLPELFACGYIPNPRIWRYGETLNGPTIAWLCETSKRLGIYLGAGFAEIDGTDFFNSFALTDPNGNLAGVARKTRAETYCFRHGAGNHVIQTDIGTIGVGICADNHFTTFPALMRYSNIDILLMPHASPMLFKTSKHAKEADIERMRENTLSLTTLYAELLGVPVMFVNPVGELQPMSGLLGKFMTPASFRLRGMSRIADSDGVLVGEMDEQEGILVAEVTFDPARKRSGTPVDYDGWLHRGSAVTRKVLIPIDNITGRLFYGLSRERQRMAKRAVCPEYQ